MSKSAPVLLVTPFRDTADVIRGVLSELGYPNLVEMDEAEAALARLMEGATCALVIADWAGGGLSLLRDMRASKSLRSTPVMLVAAGASRDMVVTAKAAGATDFLCKPFSLATLKRKLTAALPRSKSVDVIAAEA